jgi:hypothetical protein
MGNLEELFIRQPCFGVSSVTSRTARVIEGLDSSDIFCNSDYKDFWHIYFSTIWEDYYTMVKSRGLSLIALKNQKILAVKVQ